MKIIFGYPQLINGAWDGNWKEVLADGTVINHPGNQGGGTNFDDVKHAVRIIESAAEIKDRALRQVTIGAANNFLENVGLLNHGEGVVVVMDSLQRPKTPGPLGPDFP